jgi:hypothetical protein
MARLKRLNMAKKLPGKVPELASFARTIVKQMGPPNQWFTSPPVAYALVTTHIDAMETAETSTHGGAAGTADARDLAQMVVINDLDQLHAYAQSVSNQNPAQSAVIIGSSGWQQRKPLPPRANTFAVKMSKNPGEAQVKTKAAAKRGVSYEWVYSADGGKTWIPIAISSDANVTVNGLTPGATYLFRYRTWIKKVAGDWSQTISFMAT